MKTNITEVLGYLAIAVIIISLFFISIRFTGYDVTSNQTGVVNVTISGAGALNFSTALLDFGTGAVVGGQAGATLQSNGTGLNASWTGPKTTGQLVLENIGNVNVSLTLSTNKTVADFIGGTAPTFKAIVADKSEKTGACTGTQTFSSYATINQTLQTACAVFGYASAVDEIDIDFELYIPNDAITGGRTIGIVAIGTYT